MKTFLILSLLFTSVAFGATLEELQTSFMTRYDEVNATRDEQLKKLEKSYLNALERHMEKAKASGKLEQVLPVRDEMDAVRTNSEALPNLAKSVDRELQSMRSKFSGARKKIVESHASSLVELAAKMDKALAAKETELTKAGEIDEALAAKRMRETLAENPSVVTAKERASSSSSPTVTGRDWIGFEEAKLQVKEKRFYTGKINEEGFETLHHMAKWKYRETDGGKNELFVAPAPCELALLFPRKVTEMKGVVHLMLAGDAVFRVIANGEVVCTHDFLGALNTNKKVSATFPPTNKILIEFEVRQTADNFAYTALSGLRFR